MRVVFTMDAYPDDFHASDPLNELLLKGVNIGLHQLPSPGGLLPTLILDTPRGYELIINAPDERTLRASATGRLTATTDASAYALLFEGVLRSEAGELVVAVVEGAEAGLPHGYRLFGVPGDNPAAVYHGHSEQLFGASTV